MIDIDMLDIVPIMVRAIDSMLIESARTAIYSSERKKIEWPAVIVNADINDVSDWSHNTLQGEWVSQGKVFFIKESDDLMLFNLKWKA